MTKIDGIVMLVSCFTVSIKGTTTVSQSFNSLYRGGELNRKTDRRTETQEMNMDMKNYLRYDALN